MVRRRIQDHRHVLRQPAVTLPDRIVGRRAGIMHVITNVRRDKVVVGKGSVCQIGGQLSKRPHHADAIIVHDVVEVSERVMLHVVRITICRGAVRAGNIFLVSFPTDPGIVQKRREMVRRGLMIHRRRTVVVNPEVRARFEPEIIRQTRVIAGWIVILRRIRCHRQKRIIYVRRAAAAHDARPIVVLHQDDENHAVRIDPGS